MPEGPEVKTVARTLAHALVGQELGSLWHSAYSLRRPVDYALVKQFENHVVDDVSCYGKLLFINTKKKPALMAQLGMTGQLVVVPESSPIAPHTHIRWKLKNSRQELRYVDPRRFGVFDICDEANKQKLIERLGPDPFAITPKQKIELARAMQKSTRAIKEIILDQSVVVGVGNIYASEALYLARIHPLRRGCDIAINKLESLIEAIIDVLNLAYANSGTTFSNYVDGSGKKGDNLAYLKVFQKNGRCCEACNGTIERIKQGGRSTFYCPNCQH